jgi:AcrR family transcriptional regulator
MTISEHNLSLTHVEARDRLLAAALDQFTCRGYAATSVRELCEAAGVTKPVLYYYFKSKEGLYLQLMHDTYERFEAILMNLAGFKGSARERITHFCTNLMNSYIEQLPLVKLCYSIYFGTPQGAPYFNLEQFYDSQLSVLKDIVETGIAAGELKNGCSNDMVWAIAGCLNITLEEQLCHSTPRMDSAGMLRMLNLIFDGIAATQAVSCVKQGD